MTVSPVVHGLGGADGRPPTGRAAQPVRAKDLRRIRCGEPFFRWRAASPQLPWSHGMRAPPAAAEGPPPAAGADAQDAGAPTAQNGYVRAAARVDAVRVGDLQHLQVHVRQRPAFAGPIGVRRWSMRCAGRTRTSWPCRRPTPQVAWAPPDRRRAPPARATPATRSPRPASPCTKRLHRGRPHLLQADPDGAEHAAQQDDGQRRDDQPGRHRPERASDTSRTAPCRGRS